MIKLGIIFCAYDHPDYVENCLNPWIAAKSKHNIKIAGVHGLFRENAENGVKDEDFETQSKLISLNNSGELDYLYLQNNYAQSSPKKYETEAQIRNYALQYLLTQEINYVLLLDLDEFWTEQEIDNVFNYLSRLENKFYAWFSINYKNIVFDGTKYLDTFCPPRVFKVNLGAYKLNEIYWDNDFNYIDGEGKIKSYKEFSNKSIPKNLAFINHLTWLDKDGPDKYLYQMKHFGHCGYKWNEIEKRLEFNLEFYNKIGQKSPELKNL
jgi:hypothetical protein